MDKKNLAIYGAVAIITLIAACGSDGAVPPASAQTPPQDEYVIVAGTMRQSQDDPTRWEYIMDESHGALGISGWGATADGRNLTITFAQPYNRIITFIAGPDEHFAALGYAFGASVKRDRAVLRSNAGILDGSDGRDLSGGNVWFYGMFVQ